MNEISIIGAIIGLIVTLVISYYLVKYAVLSALEINSRHINNKGLEKKLDNIFIQLGGNPEAFNLIELEGKDELEAKKVSIRKTFKGSNPIWKELNEAELLSKIEINKRKREYVKNNK